MLMFDLVGLDSLEKWKSTDLNIWDYMSDKISPEDILISGKLYFPKFIKNHDFYIVEINYDQNHFEESVKNWSQKQNLTKTEFEISWNDTKLYDLFSGSSADIADGTLIQLGKILEFSWMCALKMQFPDEKFATQFRYSDEEYGPIITAWSL
jgi:hypothetical protein